MEQANNGAGLGASWLSFERVAQLTPGSCIVQAFLRACHGVAGVERRVLHYRHVEDVPVCGSAALSSFAPQIELVHASNCCTPHRPCDCGWPSKSGPRSEFSPALLTNKAACSQPAPHARLQSPRRERLHGREVLGQGAPYKAHLRHTQHARHTRHVMPRACSDNVNVTASQAQGTSTARPCICMPTRTSHKRDGSPCSCLPAHLGPVVLQRRRQSFGVGVGLAQRLGPVMASGSGTVRQDQVARGGRGVGTKSDGLGR